MVAEYLGTAMESSSCWGFDCQGAASVNQWVGKVVVGEADVTKTLTSFLELTGLSFLRI